jgi:predicted transcriptional regulator
MSDLENLIEEAAKLGFGPLWLTEVKRAVRVTTKGRFSNSSHMNSVDDLVQDVVMIKLLEANEQQKIMDLANDIGHVRALLIRLVRNRLDELREPSYKRNVYDRILEEVKARGLNLELPADADPREIQRSVHGIQEILKTLPTRRILGEEERLSPLFSSESLSHLVDEIGHKGLILTKETLWDGLGALTLFLPRLSNTVVDQNLVSEQTVLSTPEDHVSRAHLIGIAEEVVLKMSQETKECYSALLQGFGKSKSMSDLAKALGLRNRQNAAKRRDQMEAEMESIIKGLDLTKSELLEVLKLVSHILYPVADLEGFQL